MVESAQDGSHLQEILKQEGSFRNEKTQDAAKYNFRLWHRIQEALLQGPFARFFAGSWVEDGYKVNGAAIATNQALVGRQ